MRMVYAPLNPELRIDPYPIYSAIRSAEPMLYSDEYRSWTLTRHADCLDVLRNPAFSSRMAQRLRQRREALPASMVSTDPPEHTRLRAPFNSLFARIDSNSSLAGIDKFARARISECVEAEHGADLIAGFAQPVVTYVLMTSLGLPLMDADAVGKLLADASFNLDPLAPPELQWRAENASRELREYFRELVRDRRRRPRDDVLTALVTAADKADLSESETLTTCNLLLIAGHDPAVHAIGNGILALLRDPGELRRLVGHPSLLPSAVEELLRFDSPIQLAARVATRDVRVADATIREGEAVLVLIGAANRDPRAFLSPQRLDIGRRPNPHIAFGSGAHYCIGARMVRSLMRAVLGSLADDLPRIVLAGDELRWIDRLIPRGVKELPVIFQHG